MVIREETTHHPLKILPSDIVVLYGNQSSQLCIWTADVARNLANYIYGAIWFVDVLKHCMFDQGLDFLPCRPSSGSFSLVSVEAEDKELTFL